MFAAAIAVVEDDAEIRNLLAGFLGREGFAVRAAERLRIGDLTVDLGARTVCLTANGREFVLTSAE